MKTSRSILPIEFDIYNENEDQVLYITDDVTGQKLSLEIKNSSDKPILLKSLESDLSATNYHFELVFRPGILFNTPTAITLDSQHFELFFKTDESNEIFPNVDGTFSLYFRSKSDLTLQKGEVVLLDLSKIRAAAEGGSRGTRVLLKYTNLFHVGSEDFFSGYREFHLNVVNHQGRKIIPLHIGFIGHNTIVNNGERNALRLRISNSSRTDRTMEAGPDSKIVLALEGGTSTQEWTTASNELLEGVIITAKYPSVNEQIEVARGPGTTTWEMPFRTLNGNEFMDVILTNVITEHTTGHSNLYIHYENIPGYWDGEFVVTIEKSPLTYEAKNVGIGTAHPIAKLDINQSRTGSNHPSNRNGLYVTGPFAPAANGVEFRHTNGTQGIGFGYNSIYATGSNENQHLNLMPKGTGGVGVGITNPDNAQGWQGLLNVHGEEHSKLIVTTNKEGVKTGIFSHYNWNGAVGKIGTESQHDLRLMAGYGSDKLTVKTNGHIGIGTTQPIAQLDINQSRTGSNHPTAINGLYVTGPFEPAANGVEFRHTNGTQGIGFGYNSLYATGSNENQHLNLMPKGTGNVGVGTTEPGAKLTVIPASNGRGIEVLSSTAGNTHLPWSDNWNYISGRGVIFRDSGNSEKMRIDLSTGRVGIGTTNPAINLHIARGGITQPGIRIDGSAGAYWDMVVDAGDTPDQDLMFVFQGGALTGNWASMWVEPRGGIRNPSDKKLKRDIRSIEGVLAKMMKLKPRTFQWKAEPKEDTPHTNGFIAQEVEKVFPDLVKEKEGYKFLAYNEFTPLAIAAIQEMKKELDEYKGELKSNKSLIQKLSKRLDALESQ